MLCRPPKLSEVKGLGRDLSSRASYNQQQIFSWLSHKWLLLVLRIPVPWGVCWKESTEHTDSERRVGWHEQYLPIQATISTLLEFQRRLLTQSWASTLPYHLPPHSSGSFVLFLHHTPSRPLTMALEMIPPISPLFPHSFTLAWRDWTLGLWTTTLFLLWALCPCCSFSPFPTSITWLTLLWPSGLCSNVPSGRDYSCPFSGVPAPLPATLLPLPSVPLLIFIILRAVSLPRFIYWPIFGQFGQFGQIWSIWSIWSFLPLKNFRRACNLSTLHNRAWNIVGTQFIFVKSMNWQSYELQVNLSIHTYICIHIFLTATM